MELYLSRRIVTDPAMRADVIQDACQGDASSFLGTMELQFPIESELWDALETRFGRDRFQLMGDFERLV